MFRILAVLLALAPVAATAGVRAVYSSGFGETIIVEIADNGDMRIDSNSRLDLVVRGDEIYAVENRLTGPIVTRGEDLYAVLDERAEAMAARKTEPDEEVVLVADGPKMVKGRLGTLYSMPFANSPERQPMLVVSGDPALRPLARAMALELRHRMKIAAAEDNEGSQYSAILLKAMAALVDSAAPLDISSIELESVETLPIAPERFALPAEPESREALRARLREQWEAEKAPPDLRPEEETSQAIFSAGRLWLSNDAGTLSSLAEGDTTRRREQPGGFVLGLCAGPDSPLALTADGRQGKVWTLRAHRDGAWQPGRSFRRAGGESLVAVSCGPDGALLVTGRRLILLGPGGPSEVRLSEQLRPALVKPSVHVTREHVFLGINAGEWGGGLKRIDRRDGRVVQLERNASGALCGGPLNTACDAVNGIADIPWKPGCVAAAVGLVHLAPHGRIVEICGDTIASMFAKTSSGLILEGPSAGDQPDDRPSIAFFGLIRSGDTLLAAGHDGMYRLQGAGTHIFQPMPRFIEADGILVSFALPDAVLVITMIDQRASMSGGAAILIAR